MAKIWCFDIDSDGAGKYKKYFTTFKKALHEANIHSMYGKYNGEWIIDCMESCTAEETEDSLFLIGHPYNNADILENDPWVMRWFKLKIEPIEIDFDPISDGIWTLDIVKGYYSCIICGEPYEEMEVAFFPSEEAAKKYAENLNMEKSIHNNKLKEEMKKGIFTPYEYYKHIYPCSWLEECSALGNGEDYYSVGRITLY